MPPPEPPTNGPAAGRRIRLRLADTSPTPALNRYLETTPAGLTTVALPQLRLVTDIRLCRGATDPGVPVTVAALIDTGASLSVISGDTFRDMQAKPARDGGPIGETLVYPRGGRPAPLQIAGATIPVDLVRFWIEPFGYHPPDPKPVRLSRVRVVAHWLQGPMELTKRFPMILGLRDLVEAGWALAPEPVPRQPDANPRDCGPRYGRQWFLGEPGPAAATSSPASA